jgi:hypothetical protein
MKRTITFEKEKLKIIKFKTYVQYSVHCPFQDFSDGISINPFLTGWTVPGTVGGISLNEGIVEKPAETLRLASAS